MRVVPDPLAVIVTFVVPAAALLPAVKVKIEFPLPGAGIVCGLKLALTPVGRPLTVRDKSLEKPADVVVVTVVLPELPSRNARLVGEALMVKSSIESTLRATVVVCVVPNLPIAVTVTFVELAAAAAPTVKVRVELPFPGNAMWLGLKLAVTFEGRPETDNAMSLSKLLSRMVVVTVVLPEAPGTMKRLVGDALTEKVVSVMVRETFIVWVIPPPEAVTVMTWVPGAAAAVVEKVNVEVPEPGAGSDVGFSTAVTPEGSPEIERLTLELKVPKAFVKMAKLPVFPGATVKLAGEAFTVKSGLNEFGAPAITTTELLKKLASAT